MTDPWILSFEGLDVEHEGLREALCTLGNGCFATRGAAEEQRASGTHYPGTYVAGGYNALSSEVAGRTVVNEDLVNFTNWLWLTFRPADGDWLDLGKLEVLDYRQELRLREGLLVRRFRVRDAKGRVTAVESRRLVHMGKPHLAALEQSLTPENWSGELFFRSGLDGSVTNAGVARYLQLNNKHLELVTRGTIAPEGIYLLARTSQSRFEVAEAARTRVFRQGQALAVERRILQDHPERIAEELRVHVSSGEPVRVEKVVALCTSRDRGISESASAARLAIGNAPSFDELLTSHRKAWERLWHRHDVEIDSVQDGGREPDQDQLILRLHIFHLLQTVSPNTVGRDVGVPARGLHGEAYRGHIFWDELFILPVLMQRNPALARSLILYRYHRLDAARALARAEGHAGAAFPWQSSSDGREATQRLHLNPLSGRWGLDSSRLQRHVNAAITYNVWKYYEAVGDRAFLEEYGAELVLEIARFWSSLARWNERKGRYEIIGVMGPDEYHEKYPDAEVGGLRNNAYTNVMAVWCLLRALDVLEIIAAGRRAELLSMLEIDDAELQRWRDIIERMTVIFHDGVISQFEGYAELEEFDWEGYSRRYGNIERLDRILKAEGKTPDRYKVSKQADVIMLFYLFRPDELRALFERLGYPFDEDTVRRNVEYYQARTSHGSTLSKVVFTAAVHRQDCAEGCKLFLSALRSDLYDIQGGTTAEGIHLGAMAGTVDILMRHYAGMEMTREGVSFWPDMPERLRRVRFRVQFHGRWLEVELTREHLRVALDTTEPGAIPVCLQGVWRQLPQGGVVEVLLRPASEVGSFKRSLTAERPPAASAAPPRRSPAEPLPPLPDPPRWR
jgi:trehalose/maltose hydrolase-like predicted phosphorylase